MQYVYITVDGLTYTLRETSTGVWTVTNRAPQTAGEYPITISATTELGQTIDIGVTDPELVRALTLIVGEGTTVSGERMRSYWPQAISQILEFQALIKSEGFEIDFMKNDIDLMVNEAYLTTMSESRIADWEKAFEITPALDDSVEDRRDIVIARIRGQGKLNTKLIDMIVNAFTGGTAISYVENSTLFVEIKPPPANKQFKFDNVIRELEKKKPAHLGLNVTRKYSTWSEISTNFADWEAIKQRDDWQDVMSYIAP